MEQFTIIKSISFLIFILLSAFFSSAETAFTAINRLKLRSLIEKKAKGSTQLKHILENPKKLLTAILIGNNLVNIGASAMATTVIIDMLHSFGFENFAYEMAIVTGIMTFIILTFGEITPKTIAIKKPERLALLMTKPFFIILIIFHPLIIFFNYISKGLSKVLGISTTGVGQILTADEIKTIVKIAEEEGILEKEEREMIRSIFEFSETIVREIMTPRTDTVCIDLKATLEEAINLIQEKGHSRIPVFEEEIDNIVGVIYAKDLLGIYPPRQETLLKDFLREPIFIPETKNIEELLKQMKKLKFHLAIVLDEYGGMAGLVTLEDIIEEIIGEIRDEYDTDEKPAFIKIKENKYLVDARMNIDDLAEKINCEFPKDEDDYDTFGGFILSYLGKLPSKGEIIKYKNIIILVKETSKRRIKKLEVTKTNKVGNENRYPT